MVPPSALLKRVHMEAAAHIHESQSPARESQEIYPVAGGSSEPEPRLEPFANAQTSAEPVALSGIVDAILEVSRQRKLLLDELRSALQSGENDNALQLARKLCGLQG